MGQKWGEKQPIDSIYDEFHPTARILFGLITPGSRVLDVGCSTGRLGWEVRQRKGCYVAGVEIDQRKAKIAKDRLDEVLVGDIEQLSSLPFKVSRFDFIVCADILEHLREPGRTLRFLGLCLLPTGRILASIPNVANWTNRFKLLLGRWVYEEQGILDKTHLRFFDMRSVRHLFRANGFEIEDMTCTSGYWTIDERFSTRNPANLWKSLLALQFIIIARRREGGYCRP